MNNLPTSRDISPDAMRSAGQSPTELAKRAIGLLEKQIYDEFGYRVTMGAEVEFVVKVKQGATFKDNPLDLKGDKIAKSHGYTPSGEREEGDKDPLYPESPYVCYSYIEDTHKPPLYKYEVVISHKATESRTGDDATDARSFSRGLRTGDVIEATIANIHGSYRDAATATSPHFEHITKLREERIESVSTKACVNGVTNGLHINIGLNEPPDRVKRPNQPDPRVQCAKFMDELMAKNLYLMGTDSDDLARYAKRNSLKRVNVAGSRIENTIPSANSNPYYAVMLSLAGTLQGLRNARDKVPINFEKLPINIGADEAQADFRSSINPLREILNSVDKTKGSIGDQFFAAVAKMPPGTEPRLYSAPGRTRL